MKKHLLQVLGLAALAAVASGQAVKAHPVEAEDPLFSETLTNSCPANCANVALASDPLPGGLTTVEYTFNSTIPSVVAGDIKIQEFGGSTVGDVIRFENIAEKAVAFIYSADIAGGLAADVGLPGSFQSNFVTIAENSTGLALKTPSSAQPGFCASCSGAITYGLQSADTVPEPSTLLLMGSGLLLLWRRRSRAAV